MEPDIKGWLQDALHTHIGEQDLVRAKAQQAMDSAREAVDQIDKLKLDKMFFTVRIYDPWDASESIQNRRGTVKAVERGLKRAVEVAEEDHGGRSGHVRTDGVLNYTVTAHVGDLDLSVPQQIWGEFSVQGPGR